MSSVQLALKWSHMDTLKFLLHYLDAVDLNLRTAAVILKTVLYSSQESYLQYYDNI